MDQYTQAAMSYLRSKRGVRNVNHLSWTGVSEVSLLRARLCSIQEVCHPLVLTNRPLLGVA